MRFYQKQNPKKRTELFGLFAGFWLFLFLQPANAQKTYALNWDTDLSLTSLILSSNLVGTGIGREIVPLTPLQISGLDRKDVFFLDRPSTYWLHGKEDLASTKLVKAANIAPVVLFAFPKARKEAIAVSVLYLEAYSLTLGLTQLSKGLVKRTRPYVYNPDASLEAKQEGDARKSFFSGHTSSAAVSCFFAAKVWSDFHPNNCWKPAVWSVAAAIPAVTGLLRMRAGRHFFTDVAAGYAVGAAVGWLVPELHQSDGFRKKGLSLYGAPDGFGLVWHFNAPNRLVPVFP